MKDDSRYYPTRPGPFSPPTKRKAGDTSGIIWPNGGGGYYPHDEGIIWGS